MEVGGRVVKVDGEVEGVEEGEEGVISVEVELVEEVELTDQVEVEDEEIIWGKILFQIIVLV